MAQRYVCSLPNPGTEGKVHEVFYADDNVGRARAEKFAQLENKPGRGVYDCIGTLRDGAKSRSKDTVAELACLIADLDLKNIVESRDIILRRLQQLLLTPSEIRDSGFGLHAIWHLKEPVSDATGLLLAESTMRQLADLLAGDPAPTHRAALLRRPGTLNTKNGEARPCYVIETGGQYYDISEFEAMFDLYGDRPKLTRKQEAKASSPSDEPKEPVDIDARLEAMQWGGAGKAAINVTQRDVMASLVARNISLDEATATVLEATRRCVANNPEAADWDWHKEELDIAWSGARLINKNPEYADRLPDDLRTKFEQLTEAGKRPSVHKNRYSLFVSPAPSSDGSADADNSADATPPPKKEIIRKLLLEGTTIKAVLEAIGWQTISLPQHARMLGLKLTKYQEGSETKYKGVPDEGQAQTAGGKRTLVLRPFKPIDVAQLPPRRWLYGKHYQRRTVSLTAGPGGMGKSSLDMVEAIAMATARNLLGEQPEERLRVWYHNGEDPLDEIQRRIVAICSHYDIAQTELVDYFWYTSGNEFPLRVAKGYNDLKVDTDLVQQISAAVGTREIDQVVLDPLVTLHSVSEVDSGKMDAVVRLFAGIADENDAGIEIAHHVRKPAAGTNGDYDVHDIRGVAAITDAVRAARVLNRMNQEDATAAGCTDVERLARFRCDRAKGNYSPPQAATWRQFVSVELSNGDSVGVVEAWNYPGQGQETPEKVKIDRAAEFVFLSLLDKYLARGQNVSPNTGPNHAPSRFAEEQEAKVAKVPKAALRAAMNRLLDAGKIKIEASGKGDRYSRLVRGPVI
jgi:RecA-family ATPase